MSDTDPLWEFIDAINRADVDNISALLTDDHHFVDSLGMEIHGKERMIDAWEGYFHLVPDYNIEIEAHCTDGQTVVLIGTASGTYAPDGQRRPHHVWSVPAAWRVVVRDGRVAFWQVFADNEPIRRIIRGEL
ncbi:MAG: nuclear transport factor 2 family protein [Bacteroidetes bacterium]|nr:nuclear transport factor 2 family protein [Bacteroidota bacterium]